MSKLFKFLLNAIVISMVIFLSNISLFAQSSNQSKSIEDLSFLLGKWKVTRTYSPLSDMPRILTGTLIGTLALDEQFIKCTYEMERPGKIRALDEVYFNYNKIYDTYESLWLSSTWPIKVLMQGQLNQIADSLVLSTSAEFLIKDNITEYVKDKLIVRRDSNGVISFYRNTFIRTSKDPKDKWVHHMHESASLVK